MANITWKEPRAPVVEDYTVMVPGTIKRPEQVTETFTLAADASIDDMRKLKNYILKKYGDVEVQATLDELTGQYIYKVIG